MMNKMITSTCIFFFVLLQVSAQQKEKFDGLNMDMGNLSRLSDAETRSISPENITGEKGKGGMADPKKNNPRNVANSAHQASDLGIGWKVNPYIKIAPGETFTLGEIEGPGALQHIWMTPTGNWRFSIIRFYWDDEATPSVEVPVGDFFCMGWNKYSPLNSLAVTVNPGSAFNCYWKMPFRKKCKVTMENIDNADTMNVYYQINYTLTAIPQDEAYFHAQYRRSNPTKGSLHTILDNVQGKGQYVGTYMALSPNNNGWWGEGEVKFFIDGDKEFPTVNTTGTEDYFCGSYNFENRDTRRYEEFSTAYAGLPQVIRPDGLYSTQQRFGLYRWHIMDPVRFGRDLRVTIQDLGWRNGGRYYPQQSDISSVAYWYQREPHAPFPKLPSKAELEAP
jgi:hypothetical protein